MVCWRVCQRGVRGCLGRWVRELEGVSEEGAQLVFRWLGRSELEGVSEGELEVVLEDELESVIGERLYVRVCQKMYQQFIIMFAINVIVVVQLSEQAVAVWCGVLWCGVAWCNVVWCDVM